MEMQVQGSLHDSQDFNFIILKKIQDLKKQNKAMCEAMYNIKLNLDSALSSLYGLQYRGINNKKGVKSGRSKHH